MNGVVGILLLLIELAIAVVCIMGAWKMFTKANEPGWAIFIPIYNLIVILKIAGKPMWWIILCLFVPLVPALLVNISVAKSFGKGAGFGIGLTFLAPIFICILGFGDAKYMGPAG